MTKRIIILALAAACLTAPVLAADEITDPAMIFAFEAAVNRAGYNCPRAIVIHRLKHEDEFGRPFMVVCTGAKMGLSYRVTVNPAGMTRVTTWK